jgi:RNA polymerase sigma factor (sigma-70 family)
VELIEQPASRETVEIPRAVLCEFTRGDLEAFESLFRSHQTQVHGWITRIVRDPVLAEDLTIETFWRIHRAHAHFDPERSFGAWARRIATNVALDHLKTRKFDSQINFPNTIAARSNADADAAVQGQMRQKIESAFRGLPAKLQVAATLALIEERPYQEVAEALGISLAAAKSRIFRAIRILRKKLERQGIQP